MKVCSRCKNKKELPEFRKRSKSPDGLSVWCKNCFAEYDRDRYKNGGDRERKERNKKITLEKNRGFLWDILTSSSCLDCGEQDPLVLEFDHRDDVIKSANVSEMMHKNIQSIKDEIDKCDIRCANCHRRRTIKQFGLWRGAR